MVTNGIKKCQIVSYMITLGLVTPIGIIIGIVLTSSSSSQTAVVGVMQVQSSMNVQLPHPIGLGQPY